MSATPWEEPPVVAFAPELPDIGSWEWIGRDMAEALADRYRTTTFSERIGPCDVLVIVKYNLPPEIIREAIGRSRIVYAPVDYYGSPQEIDQDALMLRCCSRILLHAAPLRKYFQSYAPIARMDHHVKFAVEPSEEFRAKGPILWTGMRRNLSPVAEWVNRHPLPEELWILTNLPEEAEEADPREFGFQNDAGVRIETWSPRRHLDWSRQARAAVDIKGDDFRQRHKPPAKAIDAIASGLPLAMNADAAAVRHLAEMGFAVASPDEPDRWLSREYWQETVRFGRALRELLSKERIARRWAQIIEEVLGEPLR